VTTGNFPRQELIEEIFLKLRNIQESINSDSVSTSHTPPPPPPEIPLIDPTANVKDALGAAIARQDDLRKADKDRVDDLRKQQMMYESLLQTVRETAQKDLAAAESRRIDALNLAESRRLDAVLAEQKSAVALASEKTAAAAQALATQVLASAEALRTQVAATAATQSAAVNQLRDSVEQRLKQVEQNQYQAGGASLQRAEGRQVSQWAVGLIVGIVLVIAEVVFKLINK
jgi:acid phosphatase family membrane protein YuiD